MQDLNINYQRIDGSISKTEDRDRICKQFNTDENVNVLLMTIRVGGIGLNLQAAQRVIIFSPQWNPAVEEQAIGRAYRIGQDKDVVVYKLAVRNSIEEKLIMR